MTNISDQDNDNSDPADMPAAEADSALSGDEGFEAEPAENTEEMSQVSAQPDSALTAGSSHSEPLDDTSEIAQKQVKAMPAARPAPTLVERIDQRLRYIEGILSEKEQLQMKYVFDKIPRPYYIKWKEECNELLMLAVNLRLRKSIYLKKQKARERA